jgi:plasmid maintenance system antidote protein VapI/deoxycytidine triphosphate deaminase
LSKWIEVNDLSQKAAARELQWKEPELSMILANRRPISERMARDLARTLRDMPEYEGWTAEDWMELQKSFLEWTKTSEGARETWRAKGERAGVLCDTDILDAIIPGILKIEPFREASIQPASHDLTAGTLTERPRSPAGVLSKWIEANGLSQKAAARALQWKEPELSMILANRRPISERMARDLARTLRDMPEFEGWIAEDWMELQKSFLEWTKTSEGARETWRAKGERVGVLCDTDILDAINAGILKIEPFRETSVQPASYDLTAGTLTWFGRRNKDGQRPRFVVSDGKWATLAPGETVHVVARERFLMPVNMTARLVAVGYLVERGVLCAFGIQMEPGWEGQPYFTLFHQGDEDIEIGSDDPCVSVEFQFVHRPPKSPFGKAPRKERFLGRGER